MKEIINYSRRVMRDERIMKDLIKIILSENLLWKIYYLIRVVDDGL